MNTVVRDDSKFYKKPVKHVKSFLTPQARDVTWILHKK
jgi:hypothetical protein